MWQNADGSWSDTLVGDVLDYLKSIKQQDMVLKSVRGYVAGRVIRFPCLYDH